MDEAQNPMKLQSQNCEVKVCYSSNSSSPPPKRAFRLKARAESPKTIIKPIMMICANHWGEEMAIEKAMLQKLTK